MFKCGYKKNKAFAYRVSIGDYNYLQCTLYENFAKINSTSDMKIPQLFPLQFLKMILKSKIVSTHFTTQKVGTSVNWLKS